MSWGMNIYSLCGYVLRLTVIQHPRLHDTPKRNVTTATRMFTHSIIIINLACHVEMRSEATLSSWRLNEIDFGEEGPWFLKKKIYKDFALLLMYVSMYVQPCLHHSSLYASSRL